MNVGRQDIVDVLFGTTTGVWTESVLVLAGKLLAACADGGDSDWIKAAMREKLIWRLLEPTALAAVCSALRGDAPKLRVTAALILHDLAHHSVKVAARMVHGKPPAPSGPDIIQALMFAINGADDFRGAKESKPWPAWCMANAIDTIQVLHTAAGGAIPDRQDRPVPGSSSQRNTLQAAMAEAALSRGLLERLSDLIVRANVATALDREWSRRTEAEWGSVYPALDVLMSLVLANTAYAASPRAVAVIRGAVMQRSLVELAVRAWAAVDRRKADDPSAASDGCGHSPLGSESVVETLLYRLLMTLGELVRCGELGAAEPLISGTEKSKAHAIQLLEPIRARLRNMAETKANEPVMSLCCTCTLCSSALYLAFQLLPTRCPTFEFETVVRDSVHYTLRFCSAPVCDRREVDVSRKFRRCGRCRLACYCSGKCQAEHWPLHKMACSSNVAKAQP